MPHDYHLDASERDYFLWRNQKLQEFERNGAGRFEAEVLLTEMESDPFFIEGLDEFVDGSIADRVVLFSSHPRKKNLG
jgi:hypothetical protein